MSENDQVLAAPGPPTETAPRLSHASEIIDKLAAALCKAQAAVEAVVKTRTAKVVSKRTSSKYEYRYADLATVLDACRGALADNGLCLVQRATGRHLETLLLHVSGQWLTSQTPLLVPERVGPQDFGSAMTYARRYAVMALLALAGEDDDGQAAQRRRAPRGAQADTISASPPPDAGAMQLADQFVAAIQAAADVAELSQLGANIAAVQLPPAEKDRLRASYLERRGELQAAAA